MLFASAFADAIFNADFVNALRCPLGTIGVLSILLGLIGVKFFEKESSKIKLFVYLLLAAGVLMLAIELNKPSGNLTDPSAYPTTQPH